jgi:hypothetical protein
MMAPLAPGQARQWARHGSVRFTQAEMLTAAADEIDRLRAVLKTAVLKTVEAELRDQMQRFDVIADALEKEA